MATRRSGIPSLRTLRPVEGLRRVSARLENPKRKAKWSGVWGVIKDGFWPGVRFTDIDDLNQQARAWCERLNQKVHRTTQCIPMNRWVEEQLRPLPTDYAWERFGAEERRVSWDGFLSYDGVLYGLPA